MARLWGRSVRLSTMFRGLAVLVFFGAIYAVVMRHVDNIAAFLEHLGHYGPLGDLAFAAIYSVAAWLMLPASLFTGASGFLYGPVVGAVVAWSLSMLAGGVSYELARGWLRAPIASRLQGQLAAIDRALARRGLYAVVLMRLSPIAPYNIISYALGATGVPRRTFWLGSALGALFPTATWAVVGASVSDLAALTTGEADFGPARWLVLGATALASVGIALFVRRALAEPVADAADDAATVTAGG